MILDGLQIAKLAYQAGFRGEALNTAVAVALAESGGNTQAYNPEIAAGTPQGSGSRGLWQIYGSAHPQYNNDSAFDPRVNAQAAFQVYREAGNRFTPWSTFNAGMAIPKMNYAKAIGGLSSIGEILNTKKTSNQVTNTTQKKQPGQLAQSLSGSLQGASLGNGQTQQPDNIAESIVGAVTGGRSATDLFFYVTGVLLILIAVTFILIGFASSDTGKEIIKTGVKAAAL